MITEPQSANQKGTNVRYAGFGMVGNDRNTRSVFPVQRLIRAQKENTRYRVYYRYRVLKFGTRFQRWASQAQPNLPRYLDQSLSPSLFFDAGETLTIIAIITPHKSRKANNSRPDLCQRKLPQIAHTKTRATTTLPSHLRIILFCTHNHLASRPHLLQSPPLVRQDA